MAVPWVVQGSQDLRTRYIVIVLSYTPEGLCAHRNFGHDKLTELFSRVNKVTISIARFNALIKSNLIN